MKKPLKALVYDIGGTKVSTAIVNRNGSIRNYNKILLPKNCTISEFKKILIDQGEKTIGDQRIDSIGVASAGPIDIINGTLLKPTNLFFNKNHGGKINLKKLLVQHFKKPIVFENDADAQAIGENWRGLAQNEDDFILISLGTGVGISVFMGGKALKINNQFHPELSHIPLNAFDLSTPCGCGALGCLEAYLSGKHFANKISKLTGKNELNGQMVLNLAKNGNKIILKEFDHYSINLAHAIRIFIFSFMPKKIIFAGSFSAAYPYFNKKTKLELEKMISSSAGCYKVPKFTLSKQQKVMGLLGAGFSALVF